MKVIEYTSWLSIVVVIEMSSKKHICIDWRYLVKQRKCSLPNVIKYYLTWQKQTKKLQEKDIVPNSKMKNIDIDKYCWLTKVATSPHSAKQKWIPTAWGCSLDWRLVPLMLDSNTLVDSISGHNHNFLYVKKESAKSVTICLSARMTCKEQSSLPVFFIPNMVNIRK